MHPDTSLPPLSAETAAALRAHLETLTTRQQQVALLVINENLTYNQIARRLCISPHTIKIHLSTVYARLGISSRRRLRLLMIFTVLHYELLESHPALSGEEETPPPPA